MNKYTIAAALFCASMSTSSYSYAGVVKTVDVDSINGLYKSVSTLNVDLLQTSQSSLQLNGPNDTGWSCLSTISDTVQGIENEIGTIQIMFQIESRLKKASDETEVVKLVDVYTTGSTNILKRYREEINQLAGTCTSSVIATSKIQPILTLLDHADAIISPVLNRLDKEAKATPR